MNGSDGASQISCPRNEEPSCQVIAFEPRRVRKIVAELMAALLAELRTDPFARDIAAALEAYRVATGGRAARSIPGFGQAASLDLDLEWPDAVRERVAEVLPSAADQSSFLAWFLWDRPGPDDGPPSGLRVLRAVESSLPAAAVRLGRALASSRTSVYEVVDVGWPEGVRLREFATGHEIVLRDQVVASVVHRWDVLVARFVELDESWVAHSFQMLLPPQARTCLDEVLAELATGTSGRAATVAETTRVLKQDPPSVLRRCRDLLERFGDPPDLTNLDGQPIIVVRLHYRLLDREAALRALRTVADVDLIDGRSGARFAWLREPRGTGPEEGRVRIVVGVVTVGSDSVTVECNSQERANRLHAALARVLDGAARYSMMVHTDIENVLDRWVDDGMQPSLPALAPDELRAGLRSLWGTYLRWLDAPVGPIVELQGVTPREAVQTAEGRARLARYLNCFDLVQLGPGQEPMPLFFDLPVIRQVLGACSQPPLSCLLKMSRFEDLPCAFHGCPDED